MFYQSMKFGDIHLSCFKVIAETIFDLQPLTVTLGVAKKNLCVSYLLFIVYLYVKFHQICFSSCSVMAEIRFVMDGCTDGLTNE